jgi:hypothetical protein
MGNKYGARSTFCIHGHKHASKREAVRCVELHLLQSAGEISELKVEPKFVFEVNGGPMKMGNGQPAAYKPDFIYKENNRDVVEDVKGMIVRDFPLRAALFRACFPDIELRVIK